MLKLQYRNIINIKIKKLMRKLIIIYYFIH